MNALSDELTEKVADRAVSLMWKRFRKKIGYYTTWFPNIEPHLKYASLFVCLIAFCCSGLLFLLYFWKPGIDFLEDNFFNLPCAIYCAIYAPVQALLQLPFPGFQRRIPILKYYHQNFLIRGIAIFVLSIPASLTVISAIVGVCCFVMGLGYIFLLYFRGIEPAYLAEKEESKAEYSKLENKEDEDDDF
ncbi:hypothetical protein ABK040_016561 [Willaertia magna]